MKIAIVMLTYHPDEPAGIERAIASLAAGLRELGHHAVVIAAGCAEAGTDPDILRLRSVTFPRLVPYEKIPELLADTDAIGQEIHALLEDQEYDIVCWGDAVSGLGFLAPAPDRARTALMVHFPRADEAMRQSLARRPHAVITVSPFMVEEAARSGLDSRGWKTLPNALLHRHDPPNPQEREKIRRQSPIRVVARADPQKGVADLLRCLPRSTRPVEIVLAKAGFELQPGLQDRVLHECHDLARDRDDVTVLPPLPWDQVPAFFAGAALAVVPSTGPESFSNVAAEALSVGTPVIGFAMGHLPALVGDGGRTVDVAAAGGSDILTMGAPAVHLAAVAEHMSSLWQAATELLDDKDGYHSASRQAPLRTAPYTPTAVAKTFLECLGC